MREEHKNTSVLLKTRRNKIMRSGIRDNEIRDREREGRRGGNELKSGEGRK